MGKMRVSKAAKRKAKKVIEEPSDESEDEDEHPFKPEAKDEAAPEKVKKTKTKANRLAEMEAAADEEAVEPRGVLYVGHIPEGFFEPQMKKFFAQFGKVTRLRISRSKKNAKSKGYGFVEFEEESVAKIVAETMQGYLLFDKTLVCHLLPKEKQHPMLFKGYRRRMVNSEGVRRMKHIQAVNDRPTVEVDGEMLPRHTQRQADRRKRLGEKLKAVLANLGVEYDLDGANEVRRPTASSSATKTAAVGAASATAAILPQKKKRKVGA